MGVKPSFIIFSEGHRIEILFVEQKQQTGQFGKPHSLYTSETYVNDRLNTTTDERVNGAAF